MGGRGASSCVGAGGGSGGANKNVLNDATEYYVSGDGMWINQYLRGRGDSGELSQSEKEYLKELDSSTTNKLKDATLYRNVDAEAIFNNISDADFMDMQQGLTYGFDKDADYYQNLFLS